MHIDMNAFFAAVEQQSNPALRGRPVAVTGSGKRTIILTASYEARAFGVKTGQTIYEARAKCPDLLLVPVRNRLYAHISTCIVAIMREYTPQVEVFSIDEAFLDVTGSLTLFGSAERIAHLIKSRILARYGLTCSVGIAPNKLLAKLASEMEKPDGLTVIPPGKVSNILEKMPIGELCGIGRRMERQLNLMGIFTCGQLARFPVDILVRKFGVVGRRLHLMGMGEDDSPVVPPEEEGGVKSVGHSTTLERDVADRKTILKYLLQLSEMVGRRARRYGVMGKTVTLTIRYADFSTFSRQTTLTQPINRSGEIYRVVSGILADISLAQPVRLLGVRLSGLQEGAFQLNLLCDDRKRDRATGAMDAVNDRHGDFTVMFASLLDQEEKGSRVISPAWRPEGIRRIES